MQPGGGGGCGGCHPARLWGGAGLRQSHPVGPFQTRPDPGVSSRACLLEAPQAPGSGNTLGAPDGGLSGPLPPLGPAALPWVTKARRPPRGADPGLGPPPLGFPGASWTSPQRPRPAAGLTRFRRGLRRLPASWPLPGQPESSGPQSRRGSPSERRPPFLPVPPPHVRPADTPAPRLQPVCPAQPPAAPGQLASSGKPTFTLSFPIQSSPTSVHSRVDILTLTRSHLPTHTYRLRMNTDTPILIHTHVYTIPQRH